LNTAVAPVVVIIPELRTIPLTVRSVPVPLAIVKVVPLLTVTCPPASIVIWSAVIDSEIVTVLPLWIWTVLLAEVGQQLAAAQLAPPLLEMPHVVLSVQLPVAADL